MNTLGAVTLTGSAFDVPVRLVVPAEIESDVRDHLPPGWQEGPVPDDAETFTFDPAVAGEDLGFHYAMSHVEVHIAEHAPGRVFIHAGSVVVDGRALLLPGRTFGGKSTLTAELVGAGATYLSDEYAVITEDGLVHSYPRPLKLRDGRGRITADSLGGITGTAGYPVGLVAALRYDEAGWQVETMSPGTAALQLIDNAVAARSRPGEVLRHISAAVSAATGLMGTRGEAAEAAELLVAAVRAQPATDPSPTDTAEG